MKRWTKFVSLFLTMLLIINTLPLNFINEEIKAYANTRIDRDDLGKFARILSHQEYNTAVVRDDGTVAMLDMSGQLLNSVDDKGRNTTGWTNLDSVSLGYDHVVGLKKDGTVVANVADWCNYGQANVQDWTDVVQISTGLYNTLGLKKDGTVLAAGSFTNGGLPIANWSNIVQVSSGADHSAGLVNDGTVVASGSDYWGQLDVSGWTDIVAIAAGGWHTVGIKKDGTVVAVGANNHGQTGVADWSDIVAISASFENTVGLKQDGTVVVAGDNQAVKSIVSSWTNIVAISDGIDQIVGLKSDGTLVGTDTSGNPINFEKDPLGKVLTANQSVVIPGDNIHLNVHPNKFYTIENPQVTLDGGVNLSNQPLTQNASEDYGFDYTVQPNESGIVKATFPGITDFYNNNLSDEDLFRVLPLQSIKSSKTVTKSGDQITLIATFYESVKPGFKISLDGAVGLEPTQMNEVVGYNDTKYIINYTVPNGYTDGGVNATLTDVETNNDVYFDKYTKQNVFTKQNRAVPISSITSSASKAKIGDVVDIVVTFSEEVKNGVQIALGGSVTASPATMTEVPGSNGTKYTYSYTVPEGSEGNVDVDITNAFDLNGNLCQEYIQKNLFAIEGIRPYVTSITTSASNLKAGDEAELTVNFSEPVKDKVALSIEKNNYFITSDSYNVSTYRYVDDYATMEQDIKNKYGSEASLADWDEIKKFYSSNIEDFANKYGLQFGKFVWLKHNYRSSGVTAMRRMDNVYGSQYESYLDTIDNHFLHLYGSPYWNGYYTYPAFVTLPSKILDNTQMTEVAGSNQMQYKVKYIVKEGDIGTADDLVVKVSSIEDEIGNQGNNYTENNLIAVDGVFPKVTSVSSDSTSYNNGDFAHITATFDESVQSGVKVKLTGGINNEEYQMTEVPGSDGKEFQLYYEVKDGQKGSVDASISNIVDLAGNETTTYSQPGVFYISDPTDANLKNIVVTDGNNEYPLTPGFSPDTDTYTLNIQPNVTNVSLNAETRDPDATVIGGGMKNLVQGENDFELKVTSTDGTTKTYKVIINVVDDTKPVISGADNTTIGIGTAFDPAEGVKVIDNVDGDITSRMKIEGTVDINTLGQYEVDYSVSDKAGNTVLIKRLINVVDNTPPVKPTVNDLDENQTKIFGITEPLAKVVATVNGNEIGSTVSDGDGNYSMTIEKQKANTEISVYAVDESGNQSDTVVVVVKDVTAPAQPIVNSVGDSDEAMTGQAEPDSIVTVKANGAVISSGTVGDDGKFSVMIPKQKAGIELVITAADKAGNISEPATITVKDVTAPIPPKVYNVTDQSIGVSGKTEANAKVTIIIGSKTYTTISDMQGNYKINIPKLMVGTVISVTAKDTAGNVSLPTTVTVSDGTAPTISYVKDVTDQDTVVTGKTEALATVNVKIENSIYSSKADSEGNFNVNIPQQKGVTVIFVTAKDAAGNESNPISVTVKDITPPSNLVVNKVTDQSTEITGQAEADSSITVTIGKKRFIGKADSEGKFVIPIVLQKAGTEFSVSVQDLFGNEGPIINIIVQDVTPPKTPFVNSVTSTSTEVSGRTEAGATVTVVIGTDRYFGKADEKGFYKVTIPQQKAGTELIITVTDSAGNISLSKSVLVVADGASTNSINNLGEIRSLGNQLSAIRRQE